MLSFYFVNVLISEKNNWSKYVCFYMSKIPKKVGLAESFEGSFAIERL